MDREQKRSELRAVKSRIKEGDPRDAYEVLRELAEPGDDFSLQSRYASLYGRLEEQALELAPMRLALLGSSTMEHFAPILKWWLAREGFAAHIHVAEYDSIHQTVLDPSSELYSLGKDAIVWIFTSHRDIRFPVEPGASSEDVESAVEAAVADTASLWEALARNASCQVIQNNADRPLERVFGNYEAGAPWSRSNMLRAYNCGLAKAVTPGVTLFDLDAVSSAFGLERWHDPRYWHHSKHAFSFDAYGMVAFQGARLVAAMKGKAKKCLVLDLDNTLWGGVIGDAGLAGIRLGDGPDGEAFADFQEYILGLKRRGVILAVCSKNEEAAAKEPFERHPDMRLRLEDIAVFRANWENKADNIRDIAETLNIGLDSLVFVDDNPAERALVRTLLPEVAVPEIPEDPSHYTRVLDGGRYFEAVGFSEEDKVRGDLYRANAERTRHRDTHTDLSGYLKSLDMVARVGGFDDFNLPRIAQLVNKSNQFHLTTTRYSEAELRAIAADSSNVCLHFRLLDKFGDNGLICVVILRPAEPDAFQIDTWVMSCRVLSRTMEEFVCNEIVAAAAAAAGGRRRLVGKYIPTKKNRLVAGLYERLGFAPLGSDSGSTLWGLDILPGRPPLACFIDRDDSA